MLDKTGRKDIFADHPAPPASVIPGPWPSAPHRPGEDTEAQTPSICQPVRYGLLTLGFISVALGIIGVFLPVMPTTVFLLIALWAFSKSSVRFHRWLFDHPRLGGPLRAWHEHRIIPLRAKVMALTTMAISLVIVTVFVADGWILPVALSAVLGAIAAYIVSRPHRTAGPCATPRQA